MNTHVSISSVLERQRLEHRRQRIARVIEALRDRERALDAGTSPPGLVAALRDWQGQGREVELRLAELQRAAETPPVAPQVAGQPLTAAA
jgi:hypothetical protein